LHPAAACRLAIDRGRVDANHIMQRHTKFCGSLLELGAQSRLRRAPQ
jgi:hypothetical protein